MYRENYIKKGLKNCGTGANKTYQNSRLP